MSISLFSGLLAEPSFPARDNATLFREDLRRATLVNSVPNITETGKYLGVQMSGTSIPTNSGDRLLIPGVRVSIYPNSGYNIWAQFGEWPGETPRFGVGTGIQVELGSENPERRQAVGLAWNEVYATDYSQREISVHALYGYSSGPLHLGLMALIDLHHVLIDDAIGFRDYDETVYTVIPYFSWILGEKLRLLLSIPYNITGAGIMVGFESLIGNR